MVALVKACKTFRLSNRLAWKDIKPKVEGVEFLDERRAIMVFHKPASNTMTLLGSDHIDVVKTCSVYDGADGHSGNGVGDDEAAALRAVIKASGMGMTYITALAHDFSVFRVNTDRCLDVFCLHHLQARVGASVVMQHEFTRLPVHHGWQSCVALFGHRSTEDIGVRCHRSGARGHRSCKQITQKNGAV